MAKKKTRFVVLDRHSFIDWATDNLPLPIFTEPRKGVELVIQQEKFVNNYELHIYTSVSGEETRDIGEDAIRVLLYDPISRTTVLSAPKILRTEGATEVWDRIHNRLALLMTRAEAIPVCKKCGAHMVERDGTKGKFWGCSAWPQCGKGEAIMRQHPLKVHQDDWPMPEDEDEDMPPAPEPKQVPVVVVVKEESQDIYSDAVVTTMEPVDTKEYKYVSYKFDKFNRMQSTVIRKIGFDSDINLVLGTTTNSGKTIAAELFMGHILSQGKKVVYVSPLKSLTQEKFDQWKDTFSDYNICILTGDYVLNDERAKELNKADIITLTSEMIDSRTRKADSEKSAWMHDVGLVVVDEAHIITTERGHAVEVGLMRFSKLVPGAKILCLSATLPNVQDFCAWLTNLNGKPTKAVNSSWRPTTLEWHFTTYPQGLRYAEQQLAKIEIAVEQIMSTPEEKFLCFVHDKNTGQAMLGALQEAGIKSKFHSADLEMTERLEIEASFADRTRGLRVLVSTSTLAWGRSLPARNVVIVGVTRGMSEVDELDIVQMAGRAGRFGIDPKGDAWLICDNEIKWRALTAHPRAVTSTLLAEGVLGFHILAEIRTGTVFNEETLHKWFERSLAYLQKPWDVALEKVVVDGLLNMKMMTISPDGIYQLTGLGNISANMYFFPQDVYAWCGAFSRLNASDLWESDLALSWCVGAAPSLQLGYVPRSEEERVGQYLVAIQQLGVFRPYDNVIAADLYDLLCGGRKSFLVRGIQFDSDRISQCIQMIAGIMRWNGKAELKSLPIRLKYGVGRELVDLCSLPNIGAIRAQKLYNNGIKGLHDVNYDNKNTIEEVLGVELARKVLRASYLIQRAGNHDDE